jgi:hypothetical protein
VSTDGRSSKQIGAAPIGRSDPGAIAATVLDLLARVPADLRSGARSLAGRDELAANPARPRKFRRAAAAE